MFFEDIYSETLIISVEFHYFPCETIHVISVYKKYNDNCVNIHVSLHAIDHIYIFFGLNNFQIFTHQNC